MITLSVFSNSSAINATPLLSFDMTLKKLLYCKLNKALSLCNGFSNKRMKIKTSCGQQRQQGK
jgi:hypothetical protein